MSKSLIRQLDKLISLRLKADKAHDTYIVVSGLGEAGKFAVISPEDAYKEWQGLELDIAELLKELEASQP